MPSSFCTISTASPAEITQNATYWRDMLYERKVLVFRDLHLEPQALVNLHKVFGRPWAKPYYDLSHEPTVGLPTGDCYTIYGNKSTEATIGNRPMGWHRDIPYHRLIRYPIRSLYPIALPTQGVPTAFMNSNVIWDRITAAEAADLERMTLTIRSWYDLVFKKPKIHHIDIPLVEVHPHTKERSFLLNSTSDRGWIVRCTLDGKDVPISYLNSLMHKLETPDNVYTHDWRRGDLVLFDNMNILHGRKELKGPETRAFIRLNLKHYWQK